MLIKYIEGDLGDMVSLVTQINGLTENKGCRAEFLKRLEELTA